MTRFWRMTKMSKKTLIFDGNNTFLRCLFTDYVDPESENPDFDYWEYMTFNSILIAVRKFRADEVVLGVDNSSWRKVVYPPYKGDRKKKKERKNINWDKIYELMDQFSENWKKHFPIKVIKTFGAEADDIIGVLAKHIKNEKIVVSVDEDYLQLLKEDNIKIYHPIQKKFRQVEDVDTFLQKLYICGQKKDNIYNILTPLDFNGDEQRKAALGENKFKKILEIGIDKWLDEEGIKEVEEHNKKIAEFNKKSDKKRLLYETNLRDRYELNKRIINFEYVPAPIKKSIIDQYNNYKFNESDFIYQYFKQKNWQGFLEDFTRVENSLINLY